MKRVAVIDGGGAKGIIPLAVIKEIENNLKRPFHETFDLVVCTSVGAVISSVLCISPLSAEKFLHIMVRDIPSVFKKRFRIPILQPKYSRKPLTNILKEYIGKDTLMKACKTKLMFTSVNMVDGKTHFFKSWEEKDGELNLVDTVNRSYAAPYFFGSIADGEAVWLDGGTGALNCPLMQAFVEIERQRWLENEPVHILSLGCGQKSMQIPYNEAKKYRNLRQELYYADPIDGGLARIQMLSLQTRWMESLDKSSEELTFQRVEKYGIDEKLDVMDGVKYRFCYKKIGEEIAKQIDYYPLR